MGRDRKEIGWGVDGERGMERESDGEREEWGKEGRRREAETRCHDERRTRDRMGGGGCRGGGGKGGATLLSMWVNIVFTLEDPTSNGSDPLIC